MSPESTQSTQATTVLLDLSLPAEALSVPSARRAVVEALTGTGFESRLDDATLALSELVSNAVLHGREPIRVLLEMTEDVLVVRVRDGSPLSPSFSMLDPTAVTGRGLVLVSSVTDAFGVERLTEGSGKEVWFSLTAGAVPLGEVDVDELLASWADDLDVDPAKEDVRIVVTDLPTALMTASETHTEGVLRELALSIAQGGGETAEVRTARRLLSTAAPLDSMRAEVRRQLSHAGRRSRPTLDVRLTVRREDAELIRDLMHALDEADRLSRRGELLSLATPAEISAVRSTFLRRVLDQLRS